MGQEFMYKNRCFNKYSGQNFQSLPPYVTATSIRTPSPYKRRGRRESRRHHPLQSGDAMNEIVYRFFSALITI